MQIDEGRSVPDQRGATLRFVLRQRRPTDSYKEEVLLSSTQGFVSCLVWLLLVQRYAPTGIGVAPSGNRYQRLGGKPHRGNPNVIGLCVLDGRTLPRAAYVRYSSVRL